MGTMSNYPGIDYSGPGSTANRDPETGIRYGVISQNSIQPDVMSDIWQESRDLSYEAAVEEAKDRLFAAYDEHYGVHAEALRNALRRVIVDFVPDRHLDDALANLMDCEPDESPRDMLWDVVEQDFNDRYDSGDSHDWLWEKDGYRLENCLQSGVFVSKSPYFTYAPFCSPCVPGAGNLDSTPGELDLNSEAMASVGLSDEQWDSLGVNQQHEHYADTGFPKTFCLGHSFFDNEEAPYPAFSVATGKRVVMVEKHVSCPFCNGSRILPSGQNCGRCGGLGYVFEKVEVEQ